MEEHDDFGGLHRDVFATGKAIDRRDMMRWAVSASGLFLLGCAGAGTVTGANNDDTTGGTANGACVKIPTETAGPFPGDGSNGPNVLTQSGVVRSDIRSSFAGLSGTADGIPLSVNLTVVNSSNACALLSGYAVYIWQCDKQGRYSLYSSGVTNQNYLRGVQTTNGSGIVSFQTIFPACYQGRWPHIHFEVYPSLSAAAAVSNRVATSQLALPKTACDAVYATSGYEASITSLSQVSLASDNVFSDGSTNQVATVSGSAASGYTASLQVGV